MSISLAGKHCAVVGATGTIGFSIASAFASRGAVVTVLGRSAETAQPKLEPLLKPYVPDKNQPKDHNPFQHRFIRFDVMNHGSIKGTFGSTGPVDILVNCAGIGQSTILLRTPDQEIENIINTNLTGTMLACKYAKMRQNGCIINVSSLIAHKGVVGASVYAASKAGVIGFTRSLCREFTPRQIRVNALLPGWIASPMWDQLKEAKKEEVMSNTPSRRVGKPDEVADACIFLASNEFANNCVLNLDGGLSAS
ncbi:hypothetical protein NW762_009569 [Fusarium torreyae]|uniref:3-oxoacyl-acyl carrier protein reductase n=1 Tax=Fusarium torreyae TaxID=1237075 RepID=A0A9W8VCF8_9HYPO|nr:hypothetical protein NW762_009569 [Fusarium torreyae]